MVRKDAAGAKGPAAGKGPEGAKGPAGGKDAAGGADGTTIRPLGRPGDLGWVVMAHGEVYAAEYGFNGEFEALVARIVADYAAWPDPRREAAWIAEADGQRAGCVFLVAAGFSLVSEEPHRSFGVDLTGQYYELDLAGELSAAAR